MSSTSKLAESTPCMDSGSLLKWWLNPAKIFRTPNSKLKDVATITTVVGSGAYKQGNINNFVSTAMKKLLYFSYRNCFPKLPDGSTTDTRWGCLIRTTQMMCGTCLLKYHSDGAAVLPEAENEELKLEISKLFMDVPTAPLGIHRAEDFAHENNVTYASMLSPTEAGIALGHAFIDYHEKGGDVPFTFCCEDRNVDVTAVREKLQGGEHVFLVIPAMLGVSPMSEKYQTMMLKMLDMKSSCGIAGGYKSASLYMFGHQGNSVFFMDPHYVQKAYISEKSVGTLTGARGDMKVRLFDPCMVLGFYLHTLEDFDVFLEELEVVNAIVVFPLISISRKPKGETAVGQDRIVTADDTERENQYSATEGEGNSTEQDAAETSDINPFARGNHG